MDAAELNAARLQEIREIAKGNPADGWNAATIRFLLEELERQTARADGLDVALNVASQKLREAKDETAAVWGRVFEAEAEHTNGVLAALGMPTLQPPTDPDGGPSLLPLLPLPMPPPNFAVDQEPSPTPASGDVWGEIIATLPPGKIRKLCEERRAFGIQRYGTVLQPFNGRNWKTDAIQEALDGMAYSEQGVMEGHGVGKVARAHFHRALEALLDLESDPDHHRSQIAALGERGDLQSFRDFTASVGRAVGLPPAEEKALRETGGLHKDLVARVERLFARAAVDAEDWQEEGPCPHSDTTADTVEALAGPTIVSRCLDCGATKIRGERDWKP